MLQTEWLSSKKNLEKEFGAGRAQQMEGRVTIASLGHDIKNFQVQLKGPCHRHRYMNGWYDKAYDKAPALSISIEVARTMNMRLYSGQQRGTSNPVSCDIAPWNAAEHVSVKQIKTSDSLVHF